MKDTGEWAEIGGNLGGVGGQLVVGTLHILKSGTQLYQLKGRCRGFGDRDWHFFWGTEAQCEKAMMHILANKEQLYQIDKEHTEVGAFLND